MSCRMILLGAGASKDAGLPVSTEITRRVIERIDGGGAYLNEVARALNYVCAAIVAHNSAYGGSALEVPDIERLFSAVELLTQRHELEISPFVAAWDSAVGKHDAGSSAFYSFDRDLHKAVLNGHPSSLRLVQDVVRSTMGSDPGTVYARLRDCLVLQLRKILELDESKVDYLISLLRMHESGAIRSIASLNYDLSVEAAAKRAGIGLDAGIESFIAEGAMKWSGDRLRLLKLHGSLDWSWEEDHVDKNEAWQLAEDRIEITGEPYSDRRQPVLVFGQQGKLRSEGPFLDLLHQFKVDLDAAGELLVVGYSFRDRHVNEYIRRWLNSDQSHRILVVDPSFKPERKRDSFKWQMVVGLTCAHGRPAESHTLDRLHVVEQSAADALPALVGNWDNFWPTPPYDPTLSPSWR